MVKHVVGFVSSRRVGLVDPETGRERYIDFRRPEQKSWQLGPALSDGRRFVVVSLEDVTISRQIKGLVQSRVWIYDFASGSLTEILTRDRLSQYVGVAAVLPGGGRVVGFAVVEGEQYLFTADLDGGNRRDLTGKGDGFAYCVELAPDGRHIAYHVTGGRNAGRRARFPYSIATMPVDSGPATLVAGAEGHLYFGPRWSPDGRWLAYLDCHPVEDPAHFWSDLCVGRPDGGEHRLASTGQRHWFGTSHGIAENRGGGSNMTEWSPDGTSISYTRIAPGSHPDCDFHAERPDHEENVYNPASARGGAQLCLLDPFRGALRELTAYEEHRWDFRSAWHPAGGLIAFSRARVTHATEIWMARADGSAPRMLTRGWEERGADFPRWLSLAGDVAT